MAIAITAVILLLYALWAFSRKAVGRVSGETPPTKSRKKAKQCKWAPTGESKGRFVEYKCQTCSVVALSHTGKPPMDCKSELGGTRVN